MLEFPQVPPWSLPEVATVWPDALKSDFRALAASWRPIRRPTFSFAPFLRGARPAPRPSGGGAWAL